MTEADFKIDDVEAGQEEVEDSEEHEAEEELPGKKRKARELVSQFLKSPQVFAAVQDGRNGTVGINSSYIKSLPAAVRRRVKALKKLQGEMALIEAKFYEEFHALECRYSTLYAPLYLKRSQITNGEIEPTDAECDWPSDDEEEDSDNKLSENANKVKFDAAKSNGTKETEEEPTKGIPEFWLTTFKNDDLLLEMIQEQDEPILRHLVDVQVEYINNPPSFSINFYFDQNEYLTNSLLTKTYTLKLEPDAHSLLHYEGPEIVECKGCTIDWKQGKNVTMKLIKKIQKHKERGVKRTVTKTIPNDSFFNFFNPPEAPKEDEEVDDETENLLAADFEIGHYLRDRIIPRAVLYYTGEVERDYDVDEDEDEDEDDGEEDENNGDDYNEEEDTHFVPPL